MNEIKIKETSEDSVSPFQWKSGSDENFHHLLCQTVSRKCLEWMKKHLSEFEDLKERIECILAEKTQR